MPALMESNSRDRLSRGGSGKILKPISFFLCSLVAGVSVGVWLSADRSQSATTPTNAVPATADMLRAEHGLAQRLIAARFLDDTGWEAALLNKTDAEILGAIDHLPRDFWLKHPMADSAAYRLFRALARSRSSAALERAIALFTENGLGSKSCLRFALIGVLQSESALPLQNCFEKCPEGSWPVLVDAVVSTRTLQGLAEDATRLDALFEQLLRNQKDSKAKRESLMGKMVECWIERDPGAVLRWLKTPSGKPYKQFMGAALVAASIGRQMPADEFTAMLREIEISQLASVCCERGSTAFQTIFSNLPPGQREEFLEKYGEQLARGNPIEIGAFLEAATPEMLNHKMAKRLAAALLDYTPHLFDKLTAQLSGAERDQLLDDWMSKGSFMNARGAEFYLQKRGAGAPAGEGAIHTLAFSGKLPSALEYIQNAPKEQQSALKQAAYNAAALALRDQVDPVDDFLNFLQQVPAEMIPGVEQTIAKELSGSNPQAALRFLETRAAADAGLWATFFENARMPPDGLNDLLAKVLPRFSDPAVLHSAAVRITDMSAIEDLESAQTTVELLEDSPTKDACTGVLVKRWAEVDSSGAFQYVLQLPAGTRRDTAIAELLPQLNFAEDKRQALIRLISSDVARKTITAEAEAKTVRF